MRGGGRGGGGGTKTAVDGPPIVLVLDKPRAASDPAASRRARCDGGEWLRSRDDSPSRSETVRFSEDDETVMAKSSSVCIISWVGAGEGELALRDAPSADADVDPNAECMQKLRNVSFSSLLQHNLRAA